MNMKYIIPLLFALNAIGATTNVQPGLPISRYPNTVSPGASDLFIIARTNSSPPTNMNVKFIDLSNAVATGLSGGALFNPNQFLPGGGMTNIKDGAFMTNVSSLGITNRGLSVYGLAPASGASATFVADGTNTTIITNVLAANSTLLVSNLNDGQTLIWYLFSSNGAWNMTFPQVTRSNSNTRTFIPQPFTNTWTSLTVTKQGLWTNFVFSGQEFDLGPGTGIVLITNQATETISINVSPGGIGFYTNQFTTNVADVANNIQTPVVGALWFNGTNSPADLTNAARSGLEWLPFQKALRAGEVFGNGTPGVNVGVASNFWALTNTGPLTVTFGSNNVNKGYASSILGGFNNAIGTNTWFNVIVGGQRNFFQGAATNSFIGGGSNINVGLDTIHNAIVGGSDHIIAQYGRYNGIVGGYNNRAGTSAGVEHVANVLGGYANTADGSYNAVFGLNNSASAIPVLGGGRITIAGGEQNFAYGYANFIGAGFANGIHGFNQGGTNNVIAGGLRNVIGTAAGSAGAGYSFIGGGKSNSITAGADSSVIGGGVYGVISQGEGNVIGGGAGNTLGNFNSFGFIGGGANNSALATFASILAGNSNSITSTGTNSFIIGERQTNATHHTIQMGYFAGGANTNYLSLDTNSLRFQGNIGSFYPSNNAPVFPTAAKLGAGGFWVGNSNGNLVAIYSTDGSATAMKVLAP